MRPEQVIASLRFDPLVPVWVLVALGVLSLALVALGLARHGRGTLLRLAAFAVQLAWQIARLNIDDSALCLRLFKSNRDAGLLLFAGLLADAVMRAA